MFHPFSDKNIGPDPNRMDKILPEGSSLNRTVL
jgi:hypothetical protein